MSIIARLKEIEAAVSVPLLNIQDELSGGLRALSGIRSLLAAQNSSETDGLEELVRMVEERFERVDALLYAFAHATFGPEGHERQSQS